MDKLGIYEYVAVIVPGVAFLFGLGVMLPEAESLRSVLIPEDLGTATVHLFLAFALGHLLHTVGQLLHEWYWSDFGGLPTDWPFTRDHAELTPEHEQLVLTAIGQTEAVDLAGWRRAVAAARSLVTSDGFAPRLEAFQANYGMFRSIVVGGLILLLISPWSELDIWIACPVIGVTMLVSVLGMHRFGVHYAKELFAAVRAWSHKRNVDGLGVAGGGEAGRPVSANASPGRVPLRRRAG